MHESSVLEEQVQRYTIQADFRLRDWTDVWLAGFAVTAGCRLVSFDGALKQYEGLDFLHLKI